MCRIALERGTRGREAHFPPGLQSLKPDPPVRSPRENGDTLDRHFILSPLGRFLGLEFRLGKRLGHLHLEPLDLGRRPRRDAFMVPNVPLPAGVPVDGDIDREFCVAPDVTVFRLAREAEPGALPSKLDPRRAQGVVLVLGPSVGSNAQDRPTVGGV